MDLQPYVDAVRHELNVAAAAGGAEAQALADRLSAPLESAIRLALLEALSAAVEEITSELAPRSVEVRLQSAHALGSDAVLAAAGRAQGALSGWVHQHGAWPWVVAFALLVACALVGALFRRTRRS